METFFDKDSEEYENKLLPSVTTAELDEDMRKMGLQRNSNAVDEISDLGGMIIASLRVLMATMYLRVYT